MSGVSLTVGGAFNGHTGVVTIPSSLLFGQPSAAGSLNGVIQDYLTGIGSGLISGSTNFINNDLAAGTPAYVANGSVAGTGSPTFEEFTNTDSVGGTVAGSGNYSVAAVGAGVTDVLVQVPGNVTLAGAATATTLTFGADSNVDYSVIDPDAGTMYLAGGANSVSLFTTVGTNAETIYSAGNDTINLVGQGTDFVSVYGNAAVEITDAVANVTAEGNATTNFFWDSAHSGGSLNFVNNSTAAATIHIGVFAGGVTDAAHVTAFGGAGGGFFVGGAAGSNSLVGGTGAVTLVGAGSGDFLEAQSAGDNVLAQGSGNETLVATSATGSNSFGAGLNYPGLGNPQATGVISTEGSGAQTFFFGNVPSGETVYGSTTAGATNNYFLYSGSISANGVFTGTVGGGNYSIYNFINSNSSIFFANEDGTSATVTHLDIDQHDSSQLDLILSDGTSVEFKGLTTAQILAVHTITESPGGAIIGLTG
jgi:hypothetical protein